MKSFKEKEKLVFTGQQRKDRNSAEPYCNPMKECFLEKEYNYCQKRKKTRVKRAWVNNGINIKLDLPLVLG